MNFRILVSSANIPETVMTVVGRLGFTYTRDKVRYNVELNSLTFKGGDYEKLLFLETVICEQATIKVQTYCDGTYSTFWTGNFSWTDCKVDKDKCLVEVKASEVTAADCMLSGWELERNIYAAWPVYYPLIEVFPFAGTYELHACDGPLPSCIIGAPIECIDPTEWVMEQNTSTEDQAGNCRQVTFWHRVTATGTCSGATPVEPPYNVGEWTLLTDNCPTDSTWWREPDASIDELVPMPYGRDLSDVFDYLLSELGCGLTLVSNFLGINADATSPDNAAYTYATDYLHQLVLFQKSDVKRPNASDRAREAAFKIKINELINDLMTMFNMDWRVEGTTLRLEHASYFEQPGIWNQTNATKRNAYEYTNTDNEAVEQYFWMDEYVSAEFKGNNITYTCGHGVKDVRVATITTDVIAAQRNGSSEAFSDKGWILMATTVSAGVRVLINYNRPLSWTNLHKYLFLHNRLHAAGTINGEDVTFFSTVKRKKYEPFTVPLCCDTNFDPGNYILTEFGTGQVEKADFDVMKGLIALTLSYG